MPRIAGFSNIAYLDGKATLHALDIQGRDLGEAWLPEDVYRENPVEGLKALKATLYDLDDLASPGRGGPK